MSSFRVVPASSRQERYNPKEDEYLVCYLCGCSVLAENMPTHLSFFHRVSQERVLQHLVTAAKNVVPAEPQDCYVEAVDHVAHVRGGQSLKPRYQDALKFEVIDLTDDEEESGEKDDEAAGRVGGFPKLPNQINDKKRKVAKPRENPEALKIGTIVMAKMKGYQPWPGVVGGDPNTKLFIRGRGKQQVHIFFLETDTKCARQWVDHSNVTILQYVEESKAFSSKTVKWNKAMSLLPTLFQLNDIARVQFCHHRLGE